MNKWTRRYSWEEWRQLHPNLPLDEATRLYQEEREWFEQFYEELQNLYRNRITTIVNNLNNLKTDFTTILEGGKAAAASTIFTIPTSSVLTYTTPGAFTVNIPTTNPTEYPYNNVVAQVWGGGGAGQRSNVIGGTLYIAGTGGGAGAYSSKTYTISDNSNISIIVGGKGKYEDISQTFILATSSSVNVDSVSIFAGEGETLTNVPISTSPSSGGIAIGGDINVNGENGTIGTQINNPVTITIRGGKGGSSPNGGIGGIGGTIRVIGGIFSEQFSTGADNGKEPGAGGGGASFGSIASVPANGANGKVILTFSYQE